VNITDHSREIIVDEVKYVSERMSKAEKIEEKLFYFSGVHGIVSRIFNLEYDPDLVYLHFVTQQCHTAFQQRLAAAKGGDAVVGLAQKQLDGLTKATKELAKKIQNKEEVYDTLRKFVLLAYSTTGNGYYLMDKGILKI
jgi:hypothetical protein